MIKSSGARQEQIYWPTHTLTLKRQMLLWWWRGGRGGPPPPHPTLTYFINLSDSLSLIYESYYLSSYTCVIPWPIFFFLFYCLHIWLGLLLFLILIFFLIMILVVLFINFPDQFSCTSGFFLYLKMERYNKADKGCWPFTEIILIRLT